MVAEERNRKPLGGKSYGHIAHLPGSRMGPGDHKCHEGQKRIATEKARDRHDLITVQEKVDGCLSWRTKVMTDQGLIAIGVIVNQRLPMQVLTYNLDTGVTEYKPIIAYYRQPRSRPWVRVRVRSRRRGNPWCSVICTDRHHFYSAGQWVAAAELAAGHRVALAGDILGTEAQQIILGGLLGDSSIVRPKEYNQRAITFSHAAPQSLYFSFKLRLLSGVVHEIKGARGGFAGSTTNRRALSYMTPAINDLITRSREVDGRKQVTEQWCQNLSPRGLAIWYMDDGSCQFTNEQRPRAHLATNGFSFAEAAMLVSMLAQRFNVKADVFDYKGPTIVLTADGTEKFFDLIYPYIPMSMKYKLSPDYQHRPCVLEGDFTLPVYQGIIPTEVIEVEREDVTVWEQPDNQYDIAVADNHNYFAGGILVHNSNVGIARIAGKPYPLTRAGYVADTSPYEQHWRFGEWVYANQDRFLGVLEDGERLCGEWLMQAHGTRYRLAHEPFVVFDLMRGNERTPLAELSERVSGFGFTLPRVLHSGAPFSIDAALVAIKVSGHGALDPVEGAVWRVERNEIINPRQGGARAWRVDFLAKYVRPDKQDGIYLPEQTGCEPVWNWRPDW